MYVYMVKIIEPHKDSASGSLNNIFTKCKNGIERFDMKKKKLIFCSILDRLTSLVDLVPNDNFPYWKNRILNQNTAVII